MKQITLAPVFLWKQRKQCRRNSQFADTQSTPFQVVSLLQAKTQQTTEDKDIEYFATASPPKKAKPSSPSREKTMSKELSALLERQGVRKAETAKKVKAPGSIERKTMKQLKALANPVIGVTAVETALKPSVRQTSPEKSGLKPKFPEKPRLSGLGSPREKLQLVPVVERLKLTEKTVKTTERTDSPQGDDGVVQESTIQAMLQQHSAGAASVPGPTPGSVDPFGSFAGLGMHPMWSMYSPTFLGSAVGGLPMMDLNTAATYGYMPDTAMTTERTATPSSAKPTAESSTRKQSVSSGTPHVIKSSAKPMQQQPVKRPHSTSSQKKTPTLSQQAAKKTHSDLSILQPSVRLPKLPLTDYPGAAKKKKSSALTHKSSNIRFPAGSSKQPHFSGSAPTHVKGAVPKTHTQQPRPVSLVTSRPAPAHGVVSSGTAATMRNLKVYPVNMSPRLPPPPAHGVSSAPRSAASTSRFPGLDFSRPVPAARPRQPSSSDDDDVIVLSDSD